MSAFENDAFDGACHLSISAEEKAMLGIVKESVSVRSLNNPLSGKSATVANISILK